MNPGATPTTLPADFHPLEIIPFFRRWRSGVWRDLVYTFIWNTAIGAVFALLGLMWATPSDPMRFIWLNFAFAQCVGYSIHALFALGHALIPGRLMGALAIRVLFYAGIPLIGVVMGVIIGVNLLGGHGMPRWFLSTRGMLVLIGNGLLITGLMLLVMLPRERAARTQARIATAEREAALAQLKALQAQVEPHFLYNTLAHVTSLMDADPAQARGMLERLIAFLRTTAKAGDGSSTLRGQVDQLRAYLDILAMRMGPRLHWTIDVPAALADVAVPPALLQPLVENAVKHGLEPRIEGGSIAICAREVNGRLELTVTDSGSGFASTTEPIGGSSQLGLSLLKRRLAALFGDAASLTLAENAPHGVRATLSMPLPR